MIEYTFKYGPFYFLVHAENDKDAVQKARRSVEETSPTASDTYLKVELTAGAFEGRIYLEPGEITSKCIRKRKKLEDITAEQGVPF